MVSHHARLITTCCSQYKDERDLPIVMHLIDNELSEPYSIFTYRYFLHQWPQLCYLAYDGDKPFGVVVCKMDVHREVGQAQVLAHVGMPRRGGGRLAGPRVTTTPRSLSQLGSQQPGRTARQQGK